MRRSEPLIDSMMCLRDRERSLGPGPVGQKTFVKISRPSRRSPLSARPRTSSARVPAYTSAVSNVVMPTSRAARTHANAASSSTWPPWVSQLPYAISEMVRPERPRRLNSTNGDAMPRAGPRRVRLRRGRSERASGAEGGVLVSDVGAQGDVGLREAPAADHRRAADAVPGQAAAVVALREALGNLPLDAAAEHHGVDDHDQEE